MLYLSPKPNNSNQLKDVSKVQLSGSKSHHFKSSKVWCLNKITFAYILKTGHFPLFRHSLIPKNQFASLFGVILTQISFLPPPPQKTFHCLEKKKIQELVTLDLN